MVVHRGIFMPGASSGLMDHPLEESYYALSGEIHKEIEGTWIVQRPGDIHWAGVHVAHRSENRGNEPYHWIETIAPRDSSSPARLSYNCEYLNLLRRLAEKR